MQAYLIDPFNQSVTAVPYSGEYAEIYKLIDCNTITCVDINRFGDTVFVDDEGLINGKHQEFFLVGGYPQPLAGKGLVLGTNDEGDSVEPSINLDQLKSRIDWVPSFMLHKFA